MIREILLVENEIRDAPQKTFYPGITCLGQTRCIILQSELFDDKKFKYCITQARVGEKMATFKSNQITELDLGITISPTPPTATDNNLRPLSYRFPIMHT